MPFVSRGIRKIPESWRNPDSGMLSLMLPWTTIRKFPEYHLSCDVGGIRKIPGSGQNTKLHLHNQEFSWKWLGNARQTQTLACSCAALDYNQENSWISLAMPCTGRCIRKIPESGQNTWLHLHVSGIFLKWLDNAIETHARKTQSLAHTNAALKAEPSQQNQNMLVGSAQVSFAVIGYLNLSSYQRFEMRYTLAVSRQRHL